MKEEKHVAMDYHQITDEIFLGTNYCCGAHFKQELLAKGIVADISVEGEQLDEPWGVRYFMWLPTLDHTAPTIEALMLGVQMITTMVQNKQKIYLHCKNGHGRAPTLLAAYFMTRGKSLDEAMRFIASKRPEIHIEPVQKKQLQAFARQVHW